MSPTPSSQDGRKFRLSHPWELLPSHPPGLYKRPKEPETFREGPLVFGPRCHLLTCSLFRHIIPKRGSTRCHPPTGGPAGPSPLKSCPLHAPALGAVGVRASFSSQGSF